MGAPGYSIRERVNFKLAKYTGKHLVQSRLTAPMVSFSFDDFPKSAAKIGAAVLEEYGFRGTFYGAAGLRGTQDNGVVYFDDEDVLALSKAGHEIGCHSYSHVDLIKLSKSEVETELQRNRDYFNDLLGKQQMSSFAYPLGAISPLVKSLATSAYPICRSGWAGLNHGKIDMSLLGMTALQPDRLTPDEAREIIEEAKRTNGWIIFMVHDIADDHTDCGTSPAHFREIVEIVADAGVQVKPVKSAASQVVFGPPS